MAFGVETGRHFYFCVFVCLLRGTGAPTPTVASLSQISRRSSCEGLATVPWRDCSIASSRGIKSERLEYSAGSSFWSCSMLSRSSAYSGKIFTPNISHTSVSFRYPSRAMLTVFFLGHRNSSPHQRVDLRRSALRNMIRAGVDESVAMDCSGHKSVSVFKRYNLTSETDLREAMQSVEQYNAEQRSKIVAISQ